MGNLDGMYSSQSVEGLAVTDNLIFNYILYFTIAFSCAVMTHSIYIMYYTKKISSVNITSLIASFFLLCQAVLFLQCVNGECSKNKSTYLLNILANATCGM